MIFRWLETDWSVKDKTIAVLADLGMATIEQLAVILDVPVKTAYDYIRLARGRKTEAEAKERWIRSLRAGRKHRRIKIYTLGPSGLYYASQLTGQKRSKAPEGQIEHFLGLNDILVRLLNTGIDRKELVWLSTAETLDFIITFWERHKRKELGTPNLSEENLPERKDLIIPDAFLSLKNGVWIEYDNDTESARTVERKFQDYIKLYRELPLAYPVVWVAKNAKRRDYLQKNWKALQDLYAQAGQEIEKPEMYFYAAKEETKEIIQRIS